MGLGLRSCPLPAFHIALFFQLLAVVLFSVFHGFEHELYALLTWFCERMGVRPWCCGEGRGGGCWGGERGVLEGRKVGDEMGWDVVRVGGYSAMICCR